MEGVKIRAVKTDDCEDLYEVSSCPGVVRGTLQLPYVSADHRKKRLEDLGPDDHMLVAEVDDHVVGSLGLHRRNKRRAHVGDIGMGVHDDYQNQGIGTALMAAAIDLADNWLNLKRVELHVYTDNAPAIHMYKKLGFEVEGTHRAFAFRGGEYVDAYSMAQIKE